MGTVLVVDDHVTNRTLLTKLLRLEGFTVIPTGNVWQALAVLETQPVDLILLDFNLPGMDGDGLLRELAADARFAHLPVIMVTAQPFNREMWLAHKDHLRDWLVKAQFSPEQLLDVIQRNIVERMPCRAAN